MMQKEFAAIVILNWNGWQDTIACLESLVNLDSRNYALIVVDNASEDESKDVITNWLAQSNHINFQGMINESQISDQPNPLTERSCIYIQSSNNGGFAAGNNLGIQAALNAGCDYVWLLNNDTTVDSYALEALKTRMRKDTMIGMCGSVLRFYDNQDVVQVVGGVAFDFVRALGQQLGQGLSSNDAQIQQLALCNPTYIAGASMLLSSAFIQDVGLMEESYFLYFEEIDWAERGKPNWKTAIAADSIVFHKEGGSIGTSSLCTRSALSQYYLHKNLIRFYLLRKKYYIPFALLRVFKEMVNCLVRGQLQLFKVTCQAFYDGLLMKPGKTFN